MSKVGQPAQPPKLPAPEARIPHHPSPTSDTTKVGSVSPERIDQLDSQANRASHAKAPATAPSQALAPATQARPADQVQRVTPPSLPEVQTQTLRNFEERGIQRGRQALHDREKGAWFGGSQCCSSLSPWPTGSPDTFSGRRCGLCRAPGALSSCLGSSSRGSTADPFPAHRGQLRLHSSQWATEKPILSTMYIRG